MARAKGIRFWTPEGKRHIDFAGDRIKEESEPVLALPSPGACPDDAALGHAVEVLLAAHDAAGEMFENRTWAVSDLAHANLFTSNTAFYLEAGRRLGPYEIVAVIGAGGMGVVYRARDVRLDRIVALKVLGPGASGQPEAREGFEREARTISSLNHPDICALYDVGRHGCHDLAVPQVKIRDELLVEQSLCFPLRNICHPQFAGSLASAERL